LIPLDGSVGEGEEPLNEHLRGTEDTIGSEDNEGTSDDEGEVNEKSKLPWWKRPSPWW
jgi:hypothetical protein